MEESGNTDGMKAPFGDGWQHGGVLLMKFTVRNQARSSSRFRRRCKIDLKAGDAGAGSAAFTIDVSAGGFCAELMRVPSPGTQVTGSITIGGHEYTFRGRMVWARASERACEPARTYRRDVQ